MGSNPTGAKFSLVRGDSQLLSFKIVKMAKELFAKKCARKIVNCYRMFAELREALAGGRALDLSPGQTAS